MLAAMTTPRTDAPIPSDVSLAEQAREAIVLVCSGDLARTSSYYSPDFVDYVNDMTFRGHDGVAESVSFYRALFPDIRLEIADQVSEADRVATHWLLHGTYLRRRVTLRGITISRFDGDARIVEDIGYTDSFSFLRQLGVLRCIALAGAVLTRRIRIPRGGLRG